MSVNSNCLGCIRVSRTLNLQLPSWQEAQPGGGFLTHHVLTWNPACVWRLRPPPAPCNYFYLMDPLIHYLFILSPSLHHHSNAHNNESYHINPLCPSCHSLLALSLSPACDVSSFLPTSHLSHCSVFPPSSFSISRTTILPVILLLFFIPLSGPVSVFWRRSLCFL